ncbi:tail protein X [Castellaniella sp. S9]|uniref:tail protein X n=1 Tax=Castellaniella sp. S9 TaxID=2993652 RepID=UPI0022B5D02F|nr:tail protein X [Castellaniella sp. S9]
MARTYRTTDGEMLDAIAYRVYGTSQAVHALIDANPHVTRHGPRLPSGLVLTLPAFAPDATTPISVRLWG